jgi:hypothetical protein
MRAKSREEVLAVHIIQNAHIFNNTFVNNANFGAANLFEANFYNFQLFM